MIVQTPVVLEETGIPAVVEPTSTDTNSSVTMDPIQENQSSSLGELQDVFDDETGKRKREDEDIANQPDSKLRAAVSGLRTGLDQALRQLESAVETAEQNPNVQEFERRTEQAIMQAIDVIKPQLEKASKAIEPYTQQARGIVEPYAKQAQQAAQTAAASVQSAAAMAEPYVNQAAKSAEPYVTHAVEKAKEILKDNGWL